MVDVLHITVAHPPFDIRVFQKECRTLARAGYAVTLIAPAAADAERDGVRLHAIPLQASRLKRIREAGRMAYQIALASPAHIVHFHDPDFLPWAQQLRRRGKTVIYDMHENLPRALRSKPWIPRPIRALTAALAGCAERFLMHGMTVVFAEDSYAKDYPAARDACAVLNLPIADELLAIPTDPAPEFTLGYLGGVEAVRGSVITLQALTRLAADGLPIRFECVGDVSAAHRTELATLARDAGVPLTLHGFVLPQQGWQVLARCHAGLAVLQPIPNYFESYPTKMFEYMALGLPVIVSDFPLYRKVVESEGCGLCVNPTDPDAIAAAIRRLAEHPDEARAMGQRGRDAVIRTYNWAREGEKLLALYHRLEAHISVCAVGTGGV